MTNDHEDLSWILARVHAGEASTEELLRRVYAELRSMAEGLMRRERDGHTLQPTALVHEAFLRLAESTTDAKLDRAEYLAAAACAMRRVLVDHARGRDAQKRGGGAWKRVTLLGLEGGEEDARALDLLELHEALDKLRRWTRARRGSWSCASSAG